MNDLIPESVPPEQETSRLARASVTLIVIGWFITLLGLFPQLVRLNTNPLVFGILQIITSLFGLGTIVLGAYLLLYSTIHHERQHRLRHDVGLRLVATGYVFCCASALADILGFGSHNIATQDQAYFGVVQTTGIVVGIVIILVGMFLYRMKVE